MSLKRMKVNNNVDEEKQKKEKRGRKWEREDSRRWRAEDGRISKDLVAGIKCYHNKPYT